MLKLVTLFFISLSLENLLKEASENNPEILSVKNEYEAYILKITPAKVPPDPVISISGRNGDDSIMGAFSLSIGQMIPYPQKLYLSSYIAERNAAMKFEELRDTRITVLSELSKTYFEYSYMHSLFQIMSEIKNLYESISKIIAANYSVGKATLSELTRVLVKIGEVQAELNHIPHEIEAAKAKINYLLGKDVKSELSIPDLLPVPKNLNLVTEAESEVGKTPKILISKIQNEVKKLERKFAEAEYYPDFSVKLGGMYSRSGSIGFETMIGVSLPVYSKWKQSKKVSSKEYEQKSAEFSVSKITLETESMLREHIAHLHSLFENIKVYEETLTNAAVSVESTLSQWTTGRLTLTDALDTIREYLEVKIKFEKEKKDFWQASAEIVKIAGLDPLEVFKEVRMQ